MIRVYVDGGLPMRVFDVLASGGFLVTNDREDIGRYFTNGKDLVVYRDLQDLIEIGKYYLQHEDERQRISRQGYETVKSGHTFVHRLKQIMEHVDAHLISFVADFQEGR